MTYNVIQARLPSRFCDDCQHAPACWACAPGGTAKKAHDWANDVRPSVQFTGLPHPLAAAAMAGW